MDSQTSVLFQIKKVLTEIRNLIMPLDKIQSQVYSISKEVNAQSQRQQPTPVLRAELEIPKTISDKRDAHDDRKEKRERWMLFINIATLFALVAYSFFTYWLWKEAINSSDAATMAVKEARKSRQRAEQAFVSQQNNNTAQLKVLQDQLSAAQNGVRAIDRQVRTEERPWIIVAFDKAEEVKTFKVGDRVVITISTENTGKTPALNIQQHILFAQVESDRSPVLIEPPLKWDSQFAMD